MRKRDSRHPSWHRGFTLIELMVALALTAIITTVAAQVGSSLLSGIRRNMGRTQADEEAKLIADYLVTALQSLGGGSVRPWATVSVSNNAGVNGSDILNLVEIDDNMQCAIASRAGINLFFVDPGGCPCLTGVVDGMQAIVISPTGDRWQNVQIKSPNTAACKANLDSAAGLVTMIDHVPVGTVDANFNNGTMVIGKTKRFMITGTSVLSVQEDTNNDGTEEQTDLADNVFDLQVALGYDVPPSNSQVTDSGNQHDEWLYNSGADVWQANGLSGAERTHLRMLRLGVVVGAPARGSNNRVRVLDHPTGSLPGQARWIMRGTTATLLLRNLNIFY